MTLRPNRKKDLSASLLWTPFAPIDAVTDENREAVAKWLEDRSALLIWLTSIITGSLVALVDAIRDGRARERNVAEKEIESRLDAVPA